MGPCGSGTTKCWHGCRSPCPNDLPRRPRPPTPTRRTSPGQGSGRSHACLRTRQHRCSPSPKRCPDQSRPDTSHPSTPGESFRRVGASSGGPLADARMDNNQALAPQRAVRRLRPARATGRPQITRGHHRRSDPHVRMSRSVSRVLSMGSVTGTPVRGHPSTTAVADSLLRSTRELGRATLERSRSPDANAGPS